MLRWKVLYNSTISIVSFVPFVCVRLVFLLIRVLVLVVVFVLHQAVACKQHYFFRCLLALPPHPVSRLLVAAAAWRHISSVIEALRHLHWTEGGSCFHPKLT